MCLAKILALAHKFTKKTVWQILNFLHLATLSQAVFAFHSGGGDASIVVVVFFFAMFANASYGDAPSSALSATGLDEEDDDPTIAGSAAAAAAAAGRKGNVLPTWGNVNTMNINPLILTNIQASPYFKVNLFELKTYHEVVDEIYYRVSHLEPWERGTSKKKRVRGDCGQRWAVAVLNFSFRGRRPTFKTLRAFCDPFCTLKHIH